MLESLTGYKINESITDAYKNMYKKQVIKESQDKKDIMLDSVVTAHMEITADDPDDFDDRKFIKKFINDGKNYNLSIKLSNKHVDVHYGGPAFDMTGTYKNIIDFTAKNGNWEDFSEFIYNITFDDNNAKAALTDDKYKNIRDYFNKVNK